MLTLENISFGVKDEKGEKEIIKNLNLSIGENKFVVITGPNGGGKSTLAKLIAGIEKPVSGRILFDQEDITEKSITDPGPIWESAMRSSSRSVLKVFRCWI